MDIIKSTPTKLEVSLLGTDGKKISGLSITYTIYKLTDYSTVETGIMGEPITGIYSVSVTLTTTGQYWVVYTTPTGYEDGQELLNVVDSIAKEDTVQSVKTSVEAIRTSDLPDLATTIQTVLTAVNTHRGVTEPQIQRILGLVQENFRVVNPSYNVQGSLIAGTIKIFESASDCNNDVDPIATYSVAATYNQSKVSGYKVTKD
jgi:hypothetical protein